MKVLRIENGGVAEWLKAADCKSARVAYVGSNPTPTTIAVRVLACDAVWRWRGASVMGWNQRAGLTSCEMTGPCIS